MTLAPTVSDRPTDGFPPFDPAATCPKCDHDEVRTTHQADHIWTERCSGACPAECLIRTCQRCHYQWAEAVKP